MKRFRRAFLIAIVVLLVALVTGVSVLHLRPVRARVLAFVAAELSSRFDVILTATRLNYNLLTGSLSLEDGRLAARGHESRPFLTARRASIRLPFAAYRGRFVVDRLDLVDARLDLVRSVDGRWNLPRARGRAPSASSASWPPPDGRIDAEALLVSGLALAIDDQRNGVRFTAGGIEASLARDTPAGSAHGVLAFRNGARVEWHEHGLQLAPTEGALVFDGSSFAIQDLPLEAPEVDGRASGRVARVFVSPTLDFTVRGGVELEPLLARFSLPIPIAGKIDVAGTVGGPFRDVAVAVEADARSLAVGRAGGLAARGPIRASKAGLSSPEIIFSVPDGGSVRTSFEIPTGAAPARVAGSWSRLHVRTAFALANLNPPPVGATLNGNAELTERDGGTLRFSTAMSASRAGRTAPLGGRVEGRFTADTWYVTHDVTLPGLRARGRAQGRLHRDALLQSTLTGGSSVVVSDPGAVVDALAPFGVSAPDLVRQIEGVINAAARFSGTFGDPRLTMGIAGNQLQVPLVGQSAVSADVSVTRRRVTIAPVMATGRTTLATGLITVDPRTRALGGVMRAQTANIGDLAAVLPIDVPITGSLTVDGLLGGTISKPGVGVAARGTGLTVSGQPVDAIDARLQITRDRLSLTELRARQGGGGIEARGTYDVNTGAYTASVNATTLRWRGPLAGESESVVEMTGRFEGAGTVDHPAGHGQARVSLSAGAGSDAVGEASLGLVLDGRHARVSAFVPSLGTIVNGSVELSPELPYRAVGLVNNGDVGKAVRLAHLAREDVEGRASLSFAADGELAGDAMAQAFVNLQAVEVSAAKVPLTLSAPARIAWQRGELTVSGLEAAIGGGVARASGTWTERRKAVFEGSFSGRLADILAAARVAGVPTALAGDGLISVEVRSTGDPSTASATVTLDKGQIAWGDAPPINDLRVRTTYGNGSITSRIEGAVSTERITGGFAASASAAVRSWSLDGIEGELSFERASFDMARVTVEQQRPTRIGIRGGVVTLSDVAWSMASSTLGASGTVTLASPPVFDLAVTGSTDLRVLTVLAPAFGFDGTAGLEVRIGGTPAQPDLDGSITLSDAEVAIPTPRAIIGDLTGSIELQGSRIAIPAIKGTANGGDLTIEGAFDVANRALAGELHTRATGVAMEFPEGLRSEVDLSLTLRAGGETASLGGDVLVQRSSHTETISLARLARHRAVSPQHLLDETGPSLADRIRLDLTVETVEDLSVDNNYGRFEADASLRVRGTVARPGVIGRVSMREGGVVYLAGRTFQVNVGEATFADPSRVAPELDIEAQAVADGDVLTVRLRGPLEEPKFELSSTNRDKSADQLASDLLGTDLSQMSGEQTGQAAMTLLASDLLGVTGSKVGFDTMRLDRGDPFDMEFRADNMAIGNDADPATRLTVAKRLGDIEVTVSQNLKDSGETTVIISYFLVPAFEIRAISTDDDELGIGVRHQIDFGGAPKPPAARAEREALRVSSVTVLGNPAPLQEAQLRKRLSLDDGDRFDFFDWQRDIDRLRADYMAAGHYEARVRGRRVEDVPGSVGLEYRIQPGPRTELVVQGVELPDDERRAIEVAWTRAVFDRFLLDEIEAIVRRHLIESGHVEGVVESRFDTAAGVKRAVVTVVPGPPVEGREIRFTGNAAIDSSRLAEAVTAANLDVEGWLDPQRLVPVLQDYYRRLGYLSAGVSPGTPRAEDGQGVLPVAIDEGARADVTEVLWTGVDSVRLAAVREAAGLASPLPYDSRRIAEATDRVMRFYRARGFNTASVTPAAEAHADRATITMRIAVEEGPQQILRDVVVTGATRTREGIVSNALRLRVGEPVVFADWASSRKHLYDTNVFRQVQMVAEPMGEPAGGVQPVRARVTVVEHPRWRLRYGLQYETEPSASADAAQAESGFGVSGELRNPNLFGIAVAGGLFARYEREEQAASLFASKATFFGLPLQTSIYSFLARDHFHAPEDDTTSFIVDRIGASLEQRARRGRLGLTYAYQYEIHHLYDPARPEVEFLPHLGARANLGRVSSALMFDRRNDLLNARAGTFSSGSVEHAANWLGSDMKYTKVLVQHHMFTEVRRIVLASRAQVGHTWNPEGLLPFDRFRAGGATTVRGYPQDGLVHFDSNGLPRGGTSLVILNQEVRFPMLRRLGGVAFLDAGNTFDPEHPVEWSELKIGYGLGLRLVLPLGQLRLDFGIPGSSVAALPSVVPNSWASGRWYLGVGQVF